MKFLPPLLLGCFAITVHLGIYFSGLTVSPGNLQDPDCYMRLVQVENLLAEGISGWRNHTVDRDNFPYGLNMHWARSTDILLLSIYAPLHFLLSSSQALWWSALLISPLLLIPCLLAIDSAARETLPLEGRLLMMLFFLTQPGILNYFIAGRPDHHSLILTCLVISLSCLVLILLHPRKFTPYIVCATFISIGLWTSIESIITWVAITACLTLFWICQSSPAARIALFHTQIALMTSLFVFTETPLQLFHPSELDRLNGLHVAIFLAASLIWWLFIPVGSSRVKRLLCAAGAGAGALLVTFLCFPVLLESPWGNVSSVFKTVWLDQVQELHPLGTNPFDLFIGILAWIPSMLPGLALIFYLIRYQPKRLTDHLLTGASWILLAILTTTLSLYQKRWVSYADVIWSIPAAIALFYLFQHLQSRPGFRFYRALILVLVCGGPTLLASRLEQKQISPTDLTKTVPSSVPTSQSASLPEFLAQSDPINQHGSTILAFIDQGPEILFRTKANTIASPYHRNVDGILDAHQVLASADLENSRKILRKRHVNWLIAGKNDTEASYYEAEQGLHGLYRQLMENRPPDWLKEHYRVQTPEGLYFIYKVRL